MKPNIKGKEYMNQQKFNTKHRGKTLYRGAEIKKKRKIKEMRPMTKGNTNPEKNDKNGQRNYYTVIQ